MENGDRIDEEIKNLFNEISKEQKAPVHFSNSVMSMVQKHTFSNNGLPKWTMGLFPIPMIMLMLAGYFGYMKGWFNPLYSSLTNLFSHFNLTFTGSLSLTLVAIAYLLIARIVVGLLLMKTYNRKLI